MPCWYKLRWHKEQCGVVIAMHDDIVVEVEHRLTGSHLVKLVAKSCGLDGDMFSAFKDNLREGILGFGGALKSLGVHGLFHEFVAPYPRVRKPTGKVCTECGGSQQSEYGGDCLYCDRTGKEYVHDWNEGYRVGASIALILNILQFPDTEITSDDYQLAQMLFQVGRQRNGIGADVSPVLCTFLNTASTKVCTSICKEAQETMNAAHLRIFGEERYKATCRAALDAGSLQFDCPGDACGFFTTDSRENYRRSSGCQMSDHNVDQPGQALTLLAGFASLWGSVDRHLSGFRD